MKNKKIIFIISILLYFLSFTNLIAEDFIFNITELEISNNGNLIKGNKRGEIIADSGIKIQADNFIYKKNLNILNADGNVYLFDEINNIELYTDQIIYNKNNETITTIGNSKALGNNLLISAKKFYYNKLLNILNFNQNVKIKDDIKEIEIFSDNVTYLKNKEILFTSGYTNATFKNVYNLKSSDVYFDRNLMKIYSSKKGEIIKKNTTQYTFKKYEYLIEEEFLKAENIKILENLNKNKFESDEYFFKDGFFDLKNQNYSASETRINLKKNLFDQVKNDPRLFGVSSIKNNDLTTINKGIFTSCQKNDNCPPWSIKADKIIHDKKEKKIIYDNAFLRVYDVPVLYFPKFFHPDPSVKRQSGFLKPNLNNSSILGNSIRIPYYKVISKSKDYTFTPTIFDQNNMFIIQNEYRSKNKNSSFIADFNSVQNFKSSLSSTKNSLSHFFLNYEKKLQLDSFITSDLKIFIQKTSNDIYLKLFDSVLGNTALWPNSNEILESGVNLDLTSSNYSLNTGMRIYENLNLNSNDAYQYIFPYYNFSKNLFFSNYGIINFDSTGENSLINTNNLKTSVINNISFISKNYIHNSSGLVNNYGIYFKNLNSLGKNDPLYKNSPQISLSNIMEFNSSFPLVKKDKKYINFLTPTISLKTNPGDMQNHYSDLKRVDVNNIFNVDRLGINDSFESGTSITAGLEYDKKNIFDKKNYFGFKLATSLRKNVNDLLPASSSLNQKNSNFFGNLKYGINNFDIKYNFTVDNKIENISYNDFELKYSINNFITKFNYIDENDSIGDSNYIENTSTYKINDSNSFSFKTRRNQKINLTEYYDLVYEYNNDCLIAGIKYKKTYYEDRDIKPSEDLMFTITFFPITTFEQKVDQSLYRN